jgi:hypothetical protein
MNFQVPGFLLLTVMLRVITSFMDYYDLTDSIFQIVAVTLVRLQVQFLDMLCAYRNLGVLAWACYGCKALMVSMCWQSGIPLFEVSQSDNQC